MKKKLLITFILGITIIFIYIILIQDRKIYITNEMKAEAAEERGEEAAKQIEYVGFTVNDNGVVEYFAKLKKDNDSYYAKLKEDRAKAKEEEKKAEEKRAEEKKVEDRKTEAHEKEDFWIKADSKEGLLAAIREALGLSEELTVAETAPTAE